MSTVTVPGACAARGRRIGRGVAGDLARRGHAQPERDEHLPGCVGSDRPRRCRRVHGVAGAPPRRRSRPTSRVHARLTQGRRPSRSMRISWRPGSSSTRSSGRHPGVLAVHADRDAGGHGVDADAGGDGLQDEAQRRGLAVRRHHDPELGVGEARRAPRARCAARGPRPGPPAARCPPPSVHPDGGPGRLALDAQAGEGGGRDGRRASTTAPGREAHRRHQEERPAQPRHGASRRSTARCGAVSLALAAISAGGMSQVAPPAVAESRPRPVAAGRRGPGGSSSAIGLPRSFGTSAVMSSVAVAGRAIGSLESARAKTSS